MLIVTDKPFILSVIMLSVIMLIAVMVNAVAPRIRRSFEYEIVTKYFDFEVCFHWESFGFKNIRTYSNVFPRMDKSLHNFKNNTSQNLKILCKHLQTIFIIFLREFLILF